MSREATMDLPGYEEARAAWGCNPARREDYRTAFIYG